MTIMQREIKYRQYLGEGNWHYWGYLTDGTFRSPLVSIEEKSPSQQFTGLKDKNGKKVYEGDILVWSDFPKWKMVVEYREVLTTDGFMAGYSFGMGEKEIIGNVHENPELLK